MAPSLIPILTLAATISSTVFLRGARANTIFLEPPSVPSIRSISASGNGCPQGTSYFQPAPATNGTPSWDDWTLVMPAFEVRDSADGDPTQRTKNCQTHLNLASSPPGWQVALRSLKARGHISLDPQATVVALGTLYWSQRADDTSTINATLVADRKLSGPATIELRWDTQGPWSPCTDRGGNGILNINFRVLTRRTADGGEAYFGSGGGQPVTESLEWIWRPCSSVT